jgi:hypothetical protein
MKLPNPAHHRTGDVSLAIHSGLEGVRIGIQALEPFYATGVLIPPDHLAYEAARTLQTILAMVEDAEARQ